MTSESYLGVSTEPRACLFFDFIALMVWVTTDGSSVREGWNKWPRPWVSEKYTNTWLEPSSYG